ncbi:MAG TPA: dTDP-glucose 4,6-dehydratase [Gemmatimonadetes bacterium]|nr:dTDP-glucose 4,6-dehydratase [Gemmatimonadota bacterium]
MRLLVTGGAGFIGSNFARHVLTTSDDQVTILDALTYAGNRANLVDLEADPRLRFVHGDICDRELVASLMPGHDAVVHFAAESHVDRSIVAPDAFVRTNCDGTNVLCDVAGRSEIQKFVHVSTDEVYGSIDTGSFTESSPLAPSSPYSASKAGSDLIALAHHRTHGLPVVITRSSNNYGPYQYPEKLIPLFVTNLLEGRTVPVYGDGLNVRDWCHVEDNCAAIDLVLRQGATGEIYNIGAGHETTNLDLTHLVLAAMGKGPEAIEFVDDRLGHDRRYSLDATRVRTLGWSPRRSLEEGIVQTVDWYRSHPEWWQPLRSNVA